MTQIARRKAPARSSNVMAKLVGGMLILFSTVLVVILLALPEHEPHMFRHDGGGIRGSNRQSNAASGNRFHAYRPAKNHNAKTHPWHSLDLSQDRPRDANGNVQDLLAVRYTPANRPIVVPPSSWPVPKINFNDEKQYEYILHPGGDVKMKVPRWWTHPLHNNTLMPRKLAQQIGTCVTPDARGNFAGRGTSCPAEERTIFVALASYRDYHCRITLDSIFARAKHPDRIRVAIVDQREETDISCDNPVQPCNRDSQQAICRHREQVEVYNMDPSLAVGPIFARHLAYRFYRGEYYAMQVDAQTIFTQDWDSDIISQHGWTSNEMAVLSYTPFDVVDSIDPKTGKSLTIDRSVMCLTHYLDLNYLENDSATLQRDKAPKEPVLQPFWAAAFSFARGHFAINVPYDQYMTFLFSEEEISVALRLFTVGYDSYAPSRNVCFHTYALGDNEKVRKEVPLFWENEEKYKDDIGNYRTRVKAMVGLSPEKNVHAWNHAGMEIYGLGGARKVAKFFELYGIDPYDKTHQLHLCDVVEDGTLHKMFTKRLRSNGIGIDYDLIDYRFKDPRKKNKKSKDNKESDDTEETER